MAQDDPEVERLTLRDADSPTWNGKRVTYDRLLELIAEARKDWRIRHGIDPDAYMPGVRQ